MFGAAGRPPGRGTQVSGPQGARLIAREADSLANKRQCVPRCVTRASRTVRTCARATIRAVAPLPDLVLYTRAGCSLCDEARDAISAVLDDRRARGLPVPPFVERDIEADPDLHRRYLERIPVVEVGDDRAELIVTVGKIRRLLAPWS